VFLTAVITSLVAVVGFQAWYLKNMKQQLDGIQGKHDAIAGVVKSARTMPSSAVVTKPALSQSMQKNLNAQIQPGQQGQSIPLNPPSAFDDDFFNGSLFGQNWNPQEEFERMQQEMDRAFNNAFSGFNNSPDFDSLFKGGNSTPQMDVQEDDSKYTVIVNLPGAEEKDISVNLVGQQLTVKGEQDFEQQKKDAMGNVIFQQRRSGEFQRSITLPDPVEQNGMMTHVDDGVLTITIPKVS
jgi:HSP20 family protein